MRQFVVEGGMPHTSDTLTPTELRIIDAAIRTLIRFGEKKTGMADIAQEAGVARQTIYTAFGNKDALIARCVRYLSEQKLSAIHAGIANCQTLADKLDVYLHNIVVMSFELMEMAVDPTDIIAANNTAGQAALSASKREQLALVEGIFSPHAQGLKLHDETPETIANFVVMTAIAIKSSAKDQQDLERLISSLRRSVLCLSES